MGGAEAQIIVIDSQTAVHSFMHLDSGPGIALPDMRREHLDAVSLEADDIVPAHSTCVFEAEDGGKVDGRINGAIRTSFLCCRHHESAVVVGQVTASGPKHASLTGLRNEPLIHSQKPPHDCWGGLAFGQAPPYSFLG